MIWLLCVLFAALFLRAIWGWGKFMGPIREAEEEEEFRQAMKKRYGGTE